MAGVDQLIEWWWIGQKVYVQGCWKCAFLFGNMVRASQTGRLQ